MHAYRAAMATDAVKSAISSILQDKDFDLQEPRMKIARECAQKVLDAISGENMSAARDAFTTFATRLNEKLEALATPSSCKQLSTQKQRLWSGFHSARISELRSLWTDMYTSLGLESRFAKAWILCWVSMLTRRCLESA